jgi:hypothetical protein
MALLNGSYVKNSEINPREHRFLGNFRQPGPPRSNGANILCPCGESLQSFQSTRQHWVEGHFDIPQYVSIEKEDKA